MDVLKTIQSYRTAINRYTSLDNFFLDIGPNRLHFVVIIANILKSNANAEADKIKQTSEEVICLYRAVKEKIRYIIDLFNSLHAVSVIVKYISHLRRHTGIRTHCSL